MTDDQLPADSAVLEATRMATYMRRHFGAETVAGAPPTTPNADPAGSAEPDPEAVADEAFAAYMRQHFPVG